MDAQRHVKAKELFLAVCDAAPQERTDFLAQHCAGDAKLRSEVESLLACYDDAILEQQGTPTRAMEAPQRESIRVGKYRLLRRLGEGGMGEVYEAEQERPMRRRVALKLVKPGMGSKEVVTRFEAERQVLALMDHPNIAHVFDGGATDQGQPYFVMEFVKGVPITDYCDSYRLDTSKRLELFLQVCDGVQHAHQRGVIHRDLKPSNVLVAVHDETPIPKIIDFGIAKAIDHRLTGAAVHTEIGRFVGTPAYMSPEQADLSHLDIDTRTDVYSLGVLLYELLVGVLPFDAEGAGFDEMRRRVCAEEPERPSRRLTTQGSDSTTSAHKRSTSTESLVRRLRGDLDWIVMKALEKDRTRRYPTPAELAADVRRHLKDEPVSAGPPSSSYRVKKFVRRNKLAVGAAVAIVTALALGVAGLTFGLIEAIQARRVAQQESRAAAEVAQFLTGLFEVSDPNSARGETITARELLDRGAERVEAELAQQPAIQARMMATIGEVYRGLGLYERAEELLNDALALRDGQLGAEDHELIDNLFDLGWVVYLRGDEARGAAIAERCFELAAKVYQEGDPRWAKIKAGQAVLHRRTDNLVPAEGLLREAIAIWDENPGHGDPFYGIAHDELAYLLTDLGRLDEAQATAERGLRYREGEFGADHPSMAGGLDALATIHVNRGDLDGAQRLLERVVRIEEQALGPEHPEISATLIELSGLIYRNGDPQGARQLYERALAIAEETYGRTHANYVLTLQDLAGAFHRAEDYDNASMYYEQALEILNSRPEMNYRKLPNILNDYGNLLQLRGDDDNARIYFERALEAADNRGGLGDMMLPIAAVNLAGWYERQGDWNSALPYYRKSLAARQQQLDADDPIVGWAMNALGYTLMRTGALEESQTLLEGSREILQNARGEQHVDTAWVTHNLGLLAARQRREEAAREHFEHALAIVRKELGQEHLRVAWGLYGLAGIHWRADEFEISTRLHQQALTIQERVLGSEHREVLRNTYNLACHQARAGDAMAALATLRDLVHRGFTWDGIAKDEDLASLRGEPEFARLEAKIRGN